MADKKFISLAEAAKLTGLSSMTIRRLAKRLENSENPEDINNVTLVNDNKSPTGKKYLIALDKLMSEYSVTPVEEHDNNIVNVGDGSTMTDELLTILKEELKNKETTIKTLLKQVEEYRTAQTEAARASRLTRLLKYPEAKIELVRHLVSGELPKKPEIKTDNVIDLETTGLDGFPNDHVVEIAIVKANLRTQIIELVFSSLIHYDIEKWDEETRNSWIFEQGHMALEEISESKEDVSEIASKVQEILHEKVITSYNVKFDFDKFLFLIS